MDTEEVFDLLNNYFLLAVLTKFVFGTSFINWIEVILNKLEKKWWKNNIIFLVK